MSTSPRVSVHVTPRGFTETTRHYIRDLVYGANDGIITTFAVVSGVVGGALSAKAVLVVGAANLAADGVAMGVGNLLAIRADEQAREAAALPEQESYPWKHGAATLLAFVLAGVFPLLPYLLPVPAAHQGTWSAVVTFAALFGVGAARAMVTLVAWWRTGLETLVLGGVVAIAAYAAGAFGALLAR